MLGLGSVSSGFMPIGLVVVTWRRRAAIARTYCSGNFEARPARKNAEGGAISATDSRTGRVTPGVCALWTLWTRPIRRIVRTQTSRVPR